MIVESTPKRCSGFSDVGAMITCTTNYDVNQVGRVTCELRGVNFVVSNRECDCVVSDNMCAYMTARFITLYVAK